MSYLFLRFSILDVMYIDDNVAFLDSSKFKSAIQFITNFSLYQTLSPENLQIMHKILKKQLRHWDQLHSTLLQNYWHQNYCYLTKQSDFVYLPKYEELCELRDLFNVCAKNGIYLGDMFCTEKKDKDYDEIEVDDIEDFYLNNLFQTKEEEDELIDELTKYYCICF